MKWEDEQKISIVIPYSITDAKSSSKPVKLKIKASHAGIINGNLMFYTPKALKTGAESLRAFPKPLQKKHYNKTLGYIEDSYYEDHLVNNKYLDRINNAKSPKELVAVVNEYVVSDDYRQATNGFGVLVSKATLHNESKIKSLRNKDRGTVSIAGDSIEAYCSICATSLENCDHTVGNVYNRKQCFAVVNTLDLDHISFETIPADTRSSTTIEDSLTRGTVEIIDNNTKKGTSMKLTLSQFKDKLQDLEALFTELELTEYLEAYKTESDGASNSQYAMPDEKVLAVNTKLTAYVTNKILEVLEDSEDKTYIQVPVTEAYSKYFKDLDEEAIKASLLTVQEDPIVEPVVEELVVKETEILAPAADPVIVETTSLSITDANAFATTIMDSFNTIISTKLDDLVSTISSVLSAEKEVSANKILVAQAEALKTDLSTAKVFEQQIVSELKTSIINQIKALTGFSDTDEYITKLNNRTLEQLKMTLEDHFHLPTKQVESPVAIQDAAVTPVLTPIEVTAAAQTMSDDTNPLEITDADKIISEVVEGITNTLNKKEYATLYKDVVSKHGSTVAQRLHKVLKQTKKI